MTDESSKAPMMVNIHRCARCGKNHDELAFIKFELPIEGSDGTLWEYWSTCPETQAPVLLKVHGEE